MVIISPRDLSCWVMCGTFHKTPCRKAFYICITYDRAICHDPEMYPNPQAFNPDRYFKPNGTPDSSVFDPALIAFGFGRR